VLRRDERLFTAQTWLPGETPPLSEVVWPDPDNQIDVPVALSPALCAAVIAAIARLHAMPLPATGERPEAPLGMLPGAVRQAHERHRGQLRSRAPREPAIQRWLATSERLMSRAEPVVAEAAGGREPRATIAHLGLWPAHVLVADEALAGLLGWERAAAGSPLLDLAQAVLRLQGWRDEAVELALGAYAEVRSLSPDERRLLPAVAALDAVATTGRLLEQTYAVPGTARPPGTLRGAIDMMLGSLSALERDLTAQESVGKSRRTPWRRAAPAAPRRQREGGRPRVRRP
jgi:aminoglycoside phosphotransferase (APT) family kinase protein